MTPMLVIWMFVALFAKHFLADFVLQRPYHYLNKGTYCHPGGLEHASIHGYGTFIALILFPIKWEIVLAVSLVDHFVHYHIDWAKMKLNARMGWKPDNSEYFWWLLGLDQFLHCLTYAGIVAFIVSRSSV